MTSPRQQSTENPILIYDTLRSKLLHLDPKAVDFNPTPEHPQVWGVLMETGYQQVLFTLAALVDGTTSLYFSTGGGILGSGSHPSVGNAARKMIIAAEKAIEFCLPVTEYPHPKDGQVRFYLLAYQGIHSAVCPLSDLKTGKHPLSSLYSTGQDLITQARLVSDQKNTD